MPKLSVSDIVLDLFKRKKWVCVEDFEQLFPPKTEGHMSWGQRKRDLHKKYTIIKRKKANCPHTWEYCLTDFWGEAVLSPKEAQGCVDTPEMGKDVFQSPKPTEGLETQNSGPVYFEKDKQFVFIH